MERFGLRKWLLALVKVPFYAMFLVVYYLVLAILAAIGIVTNTIVMIIICIIQVVHRYRTGDDILDVELDKDEMMDSIGNEFKDIMKPCTKVSMWVFGIK